MSRSVQMELRIVVWVLFLAVSVTIFLFSSQDAEKSSDVSEGVVKTILSETVKEYDQLPEEEQDKMVDEAHSATRKGAHFFLYTIWGILGSSLAWLYGIKGIKQLITVILCGAVYAGSDEYHQSFVSGRSAEVRDVFIDLSGIAAGLCIVCLICLIVGYVKNKKMKNN